MQSDMKNLKQDDLEYTVSAKYILGIVYGHLIPNLKPKKMEYQLFLDYLAQYIRLTPDEKALLLSKVRYRRFWKGQYLVQEGDICYFESFVLSGCLRTFYTDQMGDEHVISISVEQNWAGDTGSFITQKPAQFSVQCIENTELLQLSYQNLEELYEKIPKLERFFRIIFQKALITSEKRIAFNFSLPARERYLNFQKEYPYIEKRVPQYMIASYLGISKEFLSKIRNQQVPEKSALVI